MADPVTSLKVFYTDSGKSTSKTIRFKGNFGFNIDGKEFKAETVMYTTKMANLFRG